MDTEGVDDSELLVLGVTVDDGVFVLDWVGEVDSDGVGDAVDVVEEDGDPVRVIDCDCDADKDWDLEGVLAPDRDPLALGVPELVIDMVPELEGVPVPEGVVEADGVREMLPL